MRRMDSPPPRTVESSHTTPLEIAEQRLTVNCYSVTYPLYVLPSTPARYTPSPHINPPLLTVSSHLALLSSFPSPPSPSSPTVRVSVRSFL